MCDNHPERNAVITIVTRILPVGSRPLFFGFELPRKFNDLCSECKASSLLFKEEDEENDVQQ